MMGLLLIWLGHAGFLIKADRKNIYIDPYKGEYEDKADIILITHSNFDHCDSSRIRRIREDNTLVIAPKNCIFKIGGRVERLKPGETFTVGNITSSI
jgi:L-ascorbate metabolism protein UlaG (beta-lactamase superfamily)